MFLAWSERQDPLQEASEAAQRVRGWGGVYDRDDLDIALNRTVTLNPNGMPPPSRLLRSTDHGDLSFTLVGTQGGNAEIRRSADLSLTTS